VKTTTFHLAVVASIIPLLTACDKSTPETVSVMPPTASSAAEAPLTNSQFAELVGRWERPDGGYVLEFRSVDANGKIEAAYFNPGPIRIESAKVRNDASITKVFVVLRDVNYPGCTYDLIWDKKTDQLYGKYFQAAMQQTYDVAFARLK
jgi:hypothetical protein